MTSLDGINGRSIQTLLRGENDSKQSDEFQAISHVVWLGKGQFQWSIGTNGTIGTNRKCHSNGSIGEYASIKGS